MSQFRVYIFSRLLFLQGLLLAAKCEEKCGERGASVIINNTFGTIEVPRISSALEETDTTCYWLFSPPFRDYEVVLSINVLGGLQTPELFIKDQRDDSRHCTRESGPCASPYSYGGSEYHGTCVITTIWWLLGHCRVEKDGEMLRCMPCFLSRDTSVKLRSGNVYCYDDCGEEFVRSSDCTHTIEKSPDAFIEYENTDLEMAFNISYRIRPCREETTTSSWHVLETTTREPTTSETIGELSTTKSHKVATSEVNTKASLSAAAKEIRRIITIALPIVAVGLLVIIVAIVVVLLKRRSKQSSSRKSIKQDVANVIYEACPHNGEKVVVENVLYGAV